MKVAVFSTHSYDREFFENANASYDHELHFFEAPLNMMTCRLAFGYPAVCVFVNDALDRQILTSLHEHGTRTIALRCAGFNNVDLAAARDLGMTVTRVPAYSPRGVAEHTVALVMTLNRQTHRAYNRVREGNFSLDGLIGFEIFGRTVGVIGTGKIGANFARIMKGFGANILAYDPYENPDCKKLGVQYVPLEELFAQSEIISLHIPLMPATHHMINEKSVAQMKNGVMLINTSRGGLLDTRAVIAGLKSGKIGYLGLDVYEEEGDVFFEDYSDHIIKDDVLARLLTFPNVVMTGHQAFFTRTALANIAQVTLKNIRDFEKGQVNPKNEVKAEPAKVK